MMNVFVKRVGQIAAGLVIGHLANVAMDKVEKFALEKVGNRKQKKEEKKNEEA